MTSSRFVGRTLAAALTIVWVTTQAGPAWADCANDAQCKGDRICEKGVCVSPPPKAPAPTVAPTSPPAPPPASPPPAYVQQPAAPLAGTRVLFEGSNDFVRAEGENGAHGECHMPCSLTLPPGWYTVHAGGKAEQIDVGNRPSMVKVSKGCMACYLTGALNLTLSIPLFVGAGVLLEENEDEAGAALAVGGGVVAATGLALIIVGAAVGGGKIVQDEYGAGPRPASRFAATPSGISYAF